MFCNYLFIYFFFHKIALFIGVNVTLKDVIRSSSFFGNQGYILKTSQQNHQPRLDTVWGRYKPDKSKDKRGTIEGGGDTDCSATSCHVSKFG